MTKSALGVLGKWLLSADLYRDKSVYWTQRIFRGEYIKVAAKKGKSYTGPRTLTFTTVERREIKQFPIQTCMRNGLNKRRQHVWEISFRRANVKQSLCLVGTRLLSSLAN